MSSSSSSSSSTTASCTLIDGEAIATQFRAEIKDRVAALQEHSQVTPGLAVILVGSRRDSQTYVNMTKKACAEAGIRSVGFDFADTVTQEELYQCVQQLNHDDSVHGILIQLPLPSHIQQDEILQAVAPHKDVDGLHPANVAALQLLPPSVDALQAPFAIPCTPLGCLVLLDRSNVSLAGKHCVVLGRSQLVGWPMARLLLSRNATVTIVHSKTVQPELLVRQADVVIAAVGKAHLVQGHWLKPGAVVIDVGMNSIDVDPAQSSNGKSYKLVGDVDFESAKQVCSQLTPVPGGVGPMTIAMLLNNTLTACERSVNGQALSLGVLVNTSCTGESAINGNP